MYNKGHPYITAKILFPKGGHYGEIPLCVCVCVCVCGWVVVENLANEPFERNWRILIWRLRCGYYSTVTLRLPENFNLAINGQIRQITAKFSRYTVCPYHMTRIFCA